MMHVIIPDPGHVVLLGKPHWDNGVNLCDIKSRRQRDNKKYMQKFETTEIVVAENQEYSRKPRIHKGQQSMKYHCMAAMCG